MAAPPSRSLSSGMFWDPKDVSPMGDVSPATLFTRDLQATANTHLDWYETEDEHVINVNVPGLSRDDLDLVVEDGHILQISGRKKRHKSEALETRRWRCAERERVDVGYYRRLKLPPNANAIEMKAHVESGVLTITIPKVQDKGLLTLAIPAAQEMKVSTIIHALSEQPKGSLKAQNAHT